MLGAPEDDETRRLAALSAAVADIDADVDDVRHILRSVYRLPEPALGPFGLFALTDGTTTVLLLWDGRPGGTSLPATIKDSDTGWTISVTGLVDAKGAAVDPTTVSVSYSNSDPSIIDVTDNANGTAGLAGVAPGTATVSASVSPTDGSTGFTLSDTVTVTAGDATSGTLTFTAP